MSKKLFVGNLDYSVTEDHIKEMFSPVGAIISVAVIKDKFSGRSKGFGFVEYETEEDAKKAVETLNGHELQGRAIVVNEARPQKPRNEG